MKNKRWFNKESKDNFYSKNILLPVGTGTVKVKPNYPYPATQDIRSNRYGIRYPGTLDIRPDIWVSECRISGNNTIRCIPNFNIILEGAQCLQSFRL